MGQELESSDARNTFEDLSGVAASGGENPYDALIQACRDDPAEIQALYSTHRTARAAQQKAKFLSADFKEVIIDPYLLRIENPDIEPGFSDPRNCLVFWARPPNHVLELAAHIQGRLREAAPHLWLMPTHRMHLTTLEITHSRTPEEIASLVSVVRPTMPELVNYTYRHRSRLVKPMLSYDLAAIALSFLPAAGEPVLSPPPVPPHPDGLKHPGFQGANVAETDTYTYHHLRRDVFALARTTGVNVQSRYVVPSAHITLGRFLTQHDHATPEGREKWIQTIDEINQWLECHVWSQPDSPFVGEWLVGQERGLDARNGPLWYGAGRSILGGEGF